MLWSASAPCLWLRAYVLCVSVLLCALGVVCLLCVLTLPRPVLGQLRSVAGSDPDALQEALSDISQSPDVDFIAAHMVGAVPLCMPSGACSYECSTACARRAVFLLPGRVYACCGRVR